MHPVYILAFATFLLVLAFFGWNLLSTHRRIKHGRNVEGIGGANDPMGAKPLDRGPGEMSASLDAASERADRAADR